MIHFSDPTRAHVPNVAKLWPIWRRPHNTWALNVCEWHHTRLPRETILGLKKQHNIHCLWRENITKHMQVIEF